MSVFDKMKKDPSLKNNFKTAKHAVPNQRVDNKSFPGEDGDYVFHFVAFKDFEANDVAYTEIQLSAASNPGQEEVVGKVVNIFTKWEENEWNTMASLMDEFMSNAQLLGVDTPNCDNVDEVKTGIEEAVKERRLVTAGVSTNKKGYRNIYLRGVYDGDAPEAAEEAPAETAKPKAAAKKSPPPAKDEWEEETAVEAPAEEVEAEETAEDDGSYLPSECVGYECVYDDATYTITAGDDEAMTVDFKDEEGNEYGPVSYDEISFPE